MWTLLGVPGVTATAFINDSQHDAEMATERSRLLGEREGGRDGNVMTRPLSKH